MLEDPTFIYEAFPKYQQWKGEPYFISEYGGTWWSKDEAGNNWGYGDRPRTEEEAIYRLGRNYRTHAKPKHATPAQYSRATGMEAVFGYLHLTGQTERATQLLSEIYDEKIAQFQDIH